MLIIGNPTNVIVGTSYQLDFATYTAWLGLPSIVAGFVSMGMLLTYFRSVFFARSPNTLELRELRGSSLESDWMAVSVPVQGEVVVRKLSAICGLFCLGATLVLMFGLSFVGVALWMIGLAFGAVMLLKGFNFTFFFVSFYNNIKKDGVLDLVELGSYRFPTVVQCLKRLPFELIPFMLGMFVLVEALKQENVLRFQSKISSLFLRFLKASVRLVMWPKDSL
jgi:Na+/H+ antiporter NhaD/arsenite permease-like protein